MPGFSPHSGEGAVSTGPMVVVHDARSIGEARAVVELLEAHAIPALVNLEVEGIVFPWAEPTKNGNARVLVPSKMLSNARDVLKRASPSSNAPPRMAPPIIARAVPRDAPTAPGPGMARELPRMFDNLRRDEPAIDEDEQDTGPIDIELPEPSPLAPRILVAMLAIAFGIGLQRLLEMKLGSAGVLEHFAARSGVLSEAWRLVTAGFLHVSPEHFVSNAIFAVLIGVVLFGTHHYGATMLVWLVSSMIGLLAESSLSGATVLIAGASAGNYGLVGLWAKGQLDRSRVSLLTRREQIRTIGILLLLLPGALTPVTSTGSRVAVFAHAVGFLAGAALGFIFERRLAPERAPIVRRRSRFALGLAVAISVAGIAAAIIAHAPILFD